MQYFHFHPFQPLRETPIIPAPPHIPAKQSTPSHADYNHRPLQVGALEHYHESRNDDGKFHVH